MVRVTPFLRDPAICVCRFQGSDAGETGESGEDPPVGPETGLGRHEQQAPQICEAFDPGGDCSDLTVVCPHREMDFETCEGGFEDGGRH